MVGRRAKSRPPPTGQRTSAVLSVSRRDAGRVGNRGEEMRRILDGESPVKVWRKKRGLTQRELVEHAGVSPSYLAEIETGKQPEVRMHFASCCAFWRCRWRISCRDQVECLTPVWVLVI